MKKMKRVLVGIFAAATLCGCAAIFCACDTGSEQEQTPPVLYSVSYLCPEGGGLRGYTKQQVKAGADGGEVLVLTDEGYRFIGWSDGVTDTRRKETNVSRDMEITALFEKLNYTATYLAGEGGSIEGDEKQTVPFKETTEGAVAVPDYGYRFKQWSDGETLELRRDCVKSDFTVTAEFEPLFSAGAGTKEAPFEITTYEQLLHITAYPSAHYLLKNDLNLYGIQHKELFPSEGFAGTFDGNGHTIRNLSVVSYEYPSLFGIVGEEGVVQNLSISGFTVVVTDERVWHTNAGGLAATSYGLLRNCSVSGTVVANGLYSGNIGGLAGASQGTIEDCSADVMIQVSNTERASNVGGLAGGSYGTVSGSSATGRIAVYSDTSGDYIGGLVGYVLAYTAHDVSITDCTARVDVSSDSGTAYVGGLVGLVRASSYSVGGEYVAAHVLVKDCSATGDVTGRYAGGLIGSCESTGGIFLLENCSAAGNVSGSSYTAGLVAHASGLLDKQSQIRSCTSSGNVEGGLSGAAGLVAKTYQIDVSDCSSDCEVQGSSTVGGLFGSLSYGTASGCAFTGTVRVLRRGGAFAAEVNKSQIENCVMSGKLIVTAQKKDFNATRVGGFVGYITSSSIRSCYCTTAISFTEEVGDCAFDDKGLIPDGSGEGFIVVSAGNGVYAFVASGSRTEFIDCHAYLSCLPTVPMTVGKMSNRKDQAVEVTGYENMQDMILPTVE